MSLLTPKDPLFQYGEFKLHSGAKSRWKIECDSLLDSDLRAIAQMLVERLPPFGAVEGVPRGGLRLAEALHLYANTGPLLIVDDVLTTGNSMIAHRGDREAIGAVIFARGLTPSWVTPLFLMPPPWRNEHDSIRGTWW